MAGDMESILFKGGDDDSSSGESDTDVPMITTTTTTTNTTNTTPLPTVLPTTATTTTPITTTTTHQPLPKITTTSTTRPVVVVDSSTSTPLPLHTPTAVSTGTSATSSSTGSSSTMTQMSQSEMAQRLKSMYSPASKATVVVAPITTTTTAAANVGIVATHHQHQQPQQQQQQQQPQPPTLTSSVSTIGIPPPPATSLVVPHHRSQQPLQPHPSQPQQQPSKVANTGSITTNYRSGSTGESSSLQHQQQQQRIISGGSGGSGGSSMQQQQQQQQQHQQQQQLQRGISQQQQNQQVLQQRSGSGIHHPLQTAVLTSTSSTGSHSTSDPHHNPSSSRSRIQQQQQSHPMQAPAIPHRPNNRVPHQQQQQSVRTVVSQGQQQQQLPSIRNPLPSAPGQSMPMSQQQQQQQGTLVPRSSGGYSSTTSASQQQQLADRAVLEKKQKERFLIFTKVLMKYLEQKDPPLHSRVKAIIKDCADRNRRKEVGFESVTASMRIQLRKVVNDVYWKKAEDYLKHFLKDKASSSQTVSTASKSNDGSSAQEAVKRSNELLTQPQQRPSEIPRGPHQDPGKGNMTQIRDDPNKKLPVLPSTVVSTKNSTQAKSAPPFFPGHEKAMPKSRAKGATTPTQQRRQSLATTPTGSEATMMAPVALVPAPASVSVPVVREYNELMEHIDHAVGVDWTMNGSLLGEAFHATMTEEQERLIYHSKGVVDVSNEKIDSVGVYFPVEGWSNRNIISSRVAWSRLRGGKRITSSGSTQANPVVAGGLLGLPHIPGKKTVTIDSNNNSASAEVDLEWYNEEKSESDAALAALSEGAEIYLKSVVMKALHCARQRQNLDGIRLWHQQLTNEDDKPSLFLRLGCDVDRQIAQAEGNAALTYKRMEEANKRRSDIRTRDHILNDYTLANAASMSDLGLRPQLEKAEEMAELEGKRKFEIYGGKYCNEPPLGRLAKVARLEVVDFQKGMSLSRPSRRHQAATSSSSFFF